MTMASADAELSIEQRTVVVFDICSSTTMLEALILRGTLQPWKDLLASLHQFMERERGATGYEIYKFIGDGWILLFKDSVTGPALMSQLDSLATYYKAKIQDVLRSLQSTPQVMGLTFGVDCGKLVRLEMAGQVEYVGRPINLAARLQGAFKSDPTPGYKVLFSKPAYNSLAIPSSWVFSEEQHPLRNVSANEPCNCVKVQLNAVREASGTAQRIARRKEQKKSCPKCGSEVRYWQHTKKGSVTAVACPNKECLARLYSEEMNGEFVLRIRGPVPERITCPNCVCEIEVGIDPVPGSVTGALGPQDDAPAGLIKKLSCPKCDRDLIVVRGLSRCRVRLARPASHPTFDEEHLEKVFEALGPQPWKKGHMADVAARLGITKAALLRAVRELTRRKKFKLQVHGRLYEEKFDEGLLNKVFEAMGPPPWPKNHVKKVAAQLGQTRAVISRAVQELVRRGAFKKTKPDQC
jgi:class 3 adenylate cyclase